MQPNNFDIYYDPSNISKYSYLLVQHKYSDCLEGTLFSLYKTQKAFYFLNEQLLSRLREKSDLLKQKLLQSIYFFFERSSLLLFCVSVSHKRENRCREFELKQIEQM